MPHNEQKAKKKVLYIITKSVWAGAGKYVYDLATGLSADSFEVFVTAGGHGELAQKMKNAGIPYFEIRHFQRDVSIFGDILAFFEIISLLFKTRPDIVHVSSSKAGGIGGVALFVYKVIRKIQKPRNKIQTIFTAHGWAFAEKRTGFQIKLIKIFSRLTCIFYNKIICVSEFDRQLAIKNRITRKKKLFTIHNGIKTDEYEFLTKETARQQLGNRVSKLDTSAVWVGTIGEFTKNKGQKFLVEAVKNLQAKSYKLQAIIIGFGEEKENLELKIKNLKLEETVFLIDNLPKASSFLKAFDIFVLPSLKEGLPYTILEAGLARLPVIASDVGGIPEIIEHPSADSTNSLQAGSGQATGLLVEAGNTEKIKETIEKILENPELKNSLAFELWGKIHQEFRFEQMLDRTLATYKKNS